MKATLLLSLLSVGLNPLKDQTLTINVTNIRADSGYIMIAIYDDKDHFLTSNVVTAGKFKVSGKRNLKCDILIPLGNYAISIFHDIDSDGKLGSNVFKIPYEPIGFSNNASTLFGPPTFEKALFSFRSAKQVHKIRLK